VILKTGKAPVHGISLFLLLLDHIVVIPMNFKQKMDEGFERAWVKVQRLLPGHTVKIKKKTKKHGPE